VAKYDIVGYPKPIDDFIAQEIGGTVRRAQEEYPDPTTQKVVLKELVRQLKKIADTPKGQPIKN